MPFSKGSYNPGVETISLMSPALADGFSTTNAIWDWLQEEQLETTRLWPGVVYKLLVSLWT